MKKTNPITRRKFIDLSAQGTAMAGLAPTLMPLLNTACIGSAEAKTIFGGCYHDCPDSCSWKMEVKESQIVAFGPNAANTYTGDQLCIKMEDFPNDVTFHPDRILTPLKRIGKKGSGEYERISWDQALKEISEKLNAVIDEHGTQAVLPYAYAGTEGLVQRSCIGDRFFARMGASKLDGTICGDTAWTGVKDATGYTVGMLPEDIVHSRMIILWGTNTKYANSHLWNLVLKARKKGAKLVVIDPFRSATAEEADWHVQPMPGTDTALALSMIQVILEEKLEDQDYIDHYTLGINQLREHVQNYSPDKISNLVGLAAENIRQLAREYASASPSVIRILIGMEHQANGASAYRAVAMLPAVTGAWRKLGGGLLHMTFPLFGEALNWSSVALGKQLWAENSRSINMVEIGKQLNNPDLNPGIHALFVYNSNPAVIAPNQNEVIRGLKREDLFTVVLEHFMTDTARYADYILPATTQLEHWDLMESWGSVYLNLNQPAIQPLGESRSNNDIFRLLAGAMEYQDEYFQETDLEIIKKTLASDHPYLQGISFESLMKTGFARLNLQEPWLPHQEGKFATESGKCMFYNEGISPALPDYKTYDHGIHRNKFPLRLLTIKSTGSFLNTSHANVKRLRKVAGVPLLAMHVQDAGDRGINDGDLVKVFNQYGELKIQVRISEKVRQGVVSIPQGYWPSLITGYSSANALTTDALSDRGGGGAFQESIVEVSLV